MSGHLRKAILAALVAGFLALALASCVARTGPDTSYEDKLKAMDATGLMRERRTLMAEEEALAGRMAATRAGDLPDTAKEAALRALGESRENVRGRLAAVEQTLRSGSFVRHEVRYRVLDLTRRAEASQAAGQSGAEPKTPPAGPASQDRPAPAAASATGTTPPAAEARATPPAAAKPTPAPASPAAEGKKTPAPRPAAPEPPAAQTAARAALSGQAQSAPAAPPAAPKPLAQAPAPLGERSAPAAQAATPAGPARVLGVETARSGNGLTVTVRLAGAAGHRLSTLNAPPRIVLDVTGLEKPAIPLPAQTLDGPEARTLRLGWHPESATLRLVLDTDAAHLGRVRVEPAPDGLRLIVAP